MQEKTLAGSKHGTDQKSQHGTQEAHGADRQTGRQAGRQAGRQKKADGRGQTVEEEAGTEQRPRL